MKEYLFGIVVTFGAWLLGYSVVRILGTGLSAVEAYALIVGWWSCAYVSSKLQVSPVVVVPVGAVYFVLFVVAALLGQDFFYRDIQGVSFVGMLAVASLQTFVVVSPVIFDSIVSLLLKKLQ